ncbi:MAG: radical SAM protein [Deltaproteobacteria bacterium]|nr:radical SAM protein [Deltaproteobacteria bacterium]
MLVWSNYIQRIPVFGRIYKNNYFSWKRSYVNFLRNTGIRPGPIVVHWLTTYRCNSNCIYCEASSNEVDCEELTTEQIKAVLDGLGELEVKHLFITGGEPLLRKDLFDVLEYAKGRQITAGMITNSLLHEKFKHHIKEAGFKSIWTSVDGIEETHNTNRGYPDAYQITLDAIRYYSEINIPLRVVNTLVHPGNYGELPELFEALKEAGINRWRLALAIPVGRGKDDKWALSPEKIEETFRFVTKTRNDFDVELSEELGYLGCWDIKTKNSPFICPSGLTFCVIMPDGNVLPCQVVYDTKYSEGNVKDTSFNEIWKNGFKRFRDARLDGNCSTCIHRKACSGGCWGRMVTEGNCLRSIWDPNNYGHEKMGSNTAL